MVNPSWLSSTIDHKIKLQNPDGGGGGGGEPQRRRWSPTIMAAPPTFFIVSSFSVPSICLDGSGRARLGGSNSSAARRRQNDDVAAAQLLPSMCRGPSLSRHSTALSLSSPATEMEAPSPA
ncbi:hypothetical protein PIB30_092365, partial [Stylosanthes scabra]|nr:hypothetical protein [Stylosanthes scabra]